MTISLNYIAASTGEIYTPDDSNPCPGSGGIATKLVRHKLNQRRPKQSCGKLQNADERSGLEQALAILLRVLFRADVNFFSARRRDGDQQSNGCNRSNPDPRLFAK